MTAFSQFGDHFNGAAKSPPDIAEAITSGKINPVLEEKESSHGYNSVYRRVTTKWLNTERKCFEVVADYEYRRGDERGFFDGYRLDLRSDIQKGLHGDGFDATMAHLGLEMIEGKTGKPRRARTKEFV